MTLTRRTFLKSGAGAGVGLALSRHPAGLSATQTERSLRFRHIRHATTLIHYAGKVLLVDPMLGEKGTMPPIDRSPQPRQNPLVPLPMNAERALEGVDAVLVTHTHRDHWDQSATKLVPKSTILFVQPADSRKFAEWGYGAARGVDETASWEGITISRTGGQHGTGETGKRLAPVSGYVLRSSGSPTVYIAGDTIWCPEVADAIRIHKPDVIFVNAGAAQFLEGGPITMDADDVISVCEAARTARVVAVHMEAINHCVLTRAGLRDALDKSRAKPRVIIPADGEELPG